MNKEAMDVVMKLKSINSSADAKLILEEMRKDIVFEPTRTYESILQRRLHVEDIYANDAKYPIFEKDIANLLKGKSVNQQIILLTEMIITC